MPRFDFSDVAAATNFDAFAGKYHVKITDVSDTEVKNSGGKLEQGTEGWNVEFTVQQGDKENRKVWNNFWFAKQTMPFLKSMLVATGRWTEDELQGNFDVDNEDLLGLDLVIKTKVRKGTGDYSDQTQITGYYPYEGVDPSTANTSGASASAGFLP